MGPVFWNVPVWMGIGQLGAQMGPIDKGHGGGGWRAGSAGVSVDRATDSGPVTQRTQRRINNIRLTLMLISVSHQ